MKRMAGTRIKAALATMLACVAIGQAARVDRIDIYDRSDNALLFVTFAYDSTGTNIGRSVFASDSTFLRSTTFAPSGSSVKETSVDFNAITVLTTTINAVSGGTSSFSTVDQFGLDQFGGAMSYTPAATSNYNLSQSGGPSYKEQYVLNADGTLAKINILDATGSLLYYAVPSAVTLVTALPHAMTGRVSSITANRGRLKVRLSLVHPGLVCVELFTPAGRRLGMPVNKTFGSGIHAFEVNAFGPSGIQLGNGAYVVRLTIDGTTAVCSTVLLER